MTSDDHTTLPPGIYLSPGLGWGGTRDLFVRLPGKTGKLVQVNRLTGALEANGPDTTGTAFLVPEITSRAWLRAIEEALPEPPTSRLAYSFYAGCLLGSAVGDALGALARTTAINALSQHYGAGPGGRDPAYGWLEPTWYTQLNLFTAEGLMRAYTRASAKGIAGAAPACVRYAYLRWMYTQGEQPAGIEPERLDGWLMTVREQFPRRNPSKTVLEALRREAAGTLETPVNTSKGSGAVPRGAIAGLAEGLGFTPFELGRHIAAATHGHATAGAATGALAALIANILAGSDLDAAIDATLAQLVSPHDEEASSALRVAVLLARQGAPTRARLASLGRGYTAEEALAIGVYCARTATNVEHGLLLAVDHDGERSATGAVAGALLGALYGRGAIPGRWLERLRSRPLVEDIARDLFCHFGRFALGYSVTSDWERYPGW